jgi:hypothetical protein
VLARLDPRTLRPLPGPRIKLRYGISSYGWSPDRSLLVLGDVDDDVLHLIDPVRLRRLGTIRFGIVARALDQIGPALLSVLDDRGRIETVLLPRARVGFQHPPDWDRPGAYGISRDAALAVDPEGGRAFVVAPDAPIAEVDLASLQVTDRQPRQPASLLRRLAHWLVPPAEASSAPGHPGGPAGSGMGGWRCWAARPGGRRRSPELRQERRSIGLKLVDVRAWTVRPLDPAATAARWEAGRLVTFGGAWDAEAQRERGVGLTVHGPGVRQPVHLLGTRLVHDARLNGDLVYASVDNGGELFGRVVVSLRSGRVVASSDQPLPYLLLGGPGPGC